MTHARSVAMALVTVATLGVAKISAQTPVNAPSSGVRRLVTADSQERPRAVTHSDWYYRRLKIHRIGSYAMFPLFAAQYYAGDQLLKDNPPGWARSVHGAGAAGLGALFGVNTVTGVWNLWETRHESPGRVRRIVHTTLMLAANAGFVWAAGSGPDDDDDEGGDDGGSDDATRHRNIALGAMGVAGVSTVMMWLWK